MNFYYWNMSQKIRFSKIKWHHHAGGHNYQLLNMCCVCGNCFKESITNAESFPLSHSSLATDRFHYIGGNSCSVTCSGFIDIRSSKAFPSSSLGLGFSSEKMFDYEYFFLNSITICDFSVSKGEAFWNCLFWLLTMLSVFTSFICETWTISLTFHAS